MVREGPFVEGLEDNLHLLLKEFTVGHLVRHGIPEGLHLTGVVAPANTENDSAAGQDVRRGVVLGQTQRVPHGGDIKSVAELESLGQIGQVYLEHQQVGDTFIPLRLKVMLGHPEGVEAQAVQRFGDGFGFVEDSG